MVRRPDKGLLGGMLGVPTSDWRAEPWTVAEAIAAAPAPADWRLIGEVEHIFTHFALTLTVLAGAAEPPDGAIWSADLSALPSVFLKAARLGGPLL